MRAAVIGSGFGGLALAIRLQASGVQTRIYERRDLPGGRAYVFKQDGFSFDSGPTLITAPECFEELFTVSGKKLEDYIKLVRLTPFYRLLWDDGFAFDYSDDKESVHAQIRARSPKDVEGYERFMAYSHEVFDQGYTNLVHETFPSVWSMLKVAPQLIRLGSHRSVYTKVKKYIADEHFREAFSFHPLLIGGSPFRTSSIYTLINHLERSMGVWFAMGGTGALVRALVKLFEDIGGEIRLSAPVEQIVVENERVKGVQTAAGFEPFDVVCSNADVLHTYETMLSKTKSAQRTAKKLRRMAQSMSLFLIYFGTKKQYPDLAHHTILFGPRYKGLLDDIFSNGVLADDFSLYLHAPGRTDPSLAPPGQEGFYVLSPVPHLGKGGIDWKKESRGYADRILAYLEKRCMPDLRANIVTEKIFTPEDFKTELNAPVGSAFSLEPILTQSAYFRTQNRDKNIKGLYIVGAGTHPGAGMPGVVNSGKATEGVIRRDIAGGALS